MPDYRARAKSIRLTLPSNPELWVEIKGEIRWGEYKHILSAKSKGEGEFLDEIARQCMIDWNLERDGKQLPLDPDELSETDFHHVLDKALDVVNEVAEEMRPNGSRPSRTSSSRGGRQGQPSNS